MNKAATSLRDTRLDVFRALALISIYVNHVPGTIYESLTHKNAGFSDAAEAFVLISGLAAGFAYGTKFVRGGRFLAAVKAWRRAGVLYVAHVMTTVATLGVFCAGAIWFVRPDLLEKINMSAVLEMPPQALVGLVTLGHQLGYNNILPVYAVILLTLPAFLFLLRFGSAATLAVSGLLWLSAGILKIAPPNYPLEGFWFLNPLSWQFLFVIGLVCAVHVKRGGRIPLRPPLVFAAAAYVLVAFVWVRVPLWGIDTSMGLPRVLTGFDKTFLSAPRLLHVLAAAYLIVVIPQISRLARTSPNNPLAVLGRHALPVFLGGTVLAMVAQVAKEVFPESFMLDSLVIAAGISLQFVLAYWLEFLRTIKVRQSMAEPLRSAVPRLRAAEPMAQGRSTPAGFLP